MDELLKIREQKTQSIGYLFLSIYRDYKEKILDKIKMKGYEGLNSSNTHIMRYIDVNGTRITELAEKASISKQSVSELVEQLENGGYIKKITDPDDSRAKRIYFTELGRQMLLDAYNMAKEIESEYINIIGISDMATLKKSISLILENKENEQNKN